MIHGVLNIYKEKGYTSHDVVARLRRIVGQKKIGHTGTLDPEAEGVLPVCLGKATKLCDLLTDKDKTYEAVLLLGISTDTQDTTGKILEEKNTADLREEAVREVVLSFEGEYDQIPPMFSALKVGGKKLYELARDGKEVERKPRHVQIYRIRILQIDLPRVRMEVTCSKGTYIRTLCHDIGEKLGCGGCMESLLRTRVERFGVAESLRISEVEQLMDEGTLQEHMIKVDEMFPDYQKVYLTPEASAAVRNGNSFRLGDVIWISELSGFQNAERVRVYDEERNFIAVYEFEKENPQYPFNRGRDNVVFSWGQVLIPKYGIMEMVQNKISEIGDRPITEIKMMYQIPFFTNEGVGLINQDISLGFRYDKQFKYGNITKSIYECCFWILEHATRTNDFYVIKDDLVQEFFSYYVIDNQYGLGPMVICSSCNEKY